MMIRVCVLPQEVNSVQTRSKRSTTAWFVDRHMQVMARGRVETDYFNKLILVGATGAGL